MNRETDFENFEIIKNLSESGNKPVWLIGNNGFFAVKKQITRESLPIYQKLSGLRSKHLPEIYYIEDAGESIYIYEQYIKGRTLREQLEYGSFSEEDAKHIIIQLCHALEVLHSAGIIHRDIKPENIIFSGATVCLIDFNISRIHRGNKNNDTTYMGTPNYASPEQYGFDETDERSDIFSLGRVFYELLTGKIENKISYPGETGRIIEKCCRMDSAQRYPNIKLLKEDLMGISEKEKNLLESKIKETKYINGIFLSVMQFWAIEALPVALIQCYHRSKSALLHGFDFFTQIMRKYTGDEFNGIFNIDMSLFIWFFLICACIAIFMLARATKKGSMPAAITLTLLYLYDFHWQLSAFADSVSLYEPYSPIRWTDIFNFFLHIGVAVFLIKILSDIPRLRNSENTLKEYKN